MARKDTLLKRVASIQSGIATLEVNYYDYGHAYLEDPRGCTATSYLSSHSDVVLGFVLTKEACCVRFCRRLRGGKLQAGRLPARAAPFRPIDARMRHQMQSALEIARRLQHALRCFKYLCCARLAATSR
jgi:hypothetical protein